MKPTYRAQLLAPFEVCDSEFHATITQTAEGYTVAWDDCAVNEWTETAPTLEAVFCLLSLIARDAHHAGRWTN